jgi:hypothetical protein
VFADYATPEQVATAAREPSPALLDAVRSFVECARRGDYYDPVFCSGRHYDAWPRATHNFSARLDLLFERCKAEASSGDPAEICTAYEHLFQLVRHIDECRDDVVFFADEAGSGQLGIAWASVLPPYLRCLSGLLGPNELAARKAALVEEFDCAGVEGLETALASAE